MYVCMYVRTYVRTYVCMYVCMYVWQGISTASKTTDGPRVTPHGDHLTGKDDKGDQPSGGETWTNTGATRNGRGPHKHGMLRHSPNHGTQRLPNDDDDDMCMHVCVIVPTVYLKWLATVKATKLPAGELGRYKPTVVQAWL